MKDVGFGNHNSKVVFTRKEAYVTPKKKEIHYRTLSKWKNLNASFNKPYYPNKKKGTLFYWKKPRHMSSRTIVRISRSNTRQGNLVVKENKLYVATMLINKGKDPTGYIDIGATQHMA